MSGTQKGSFDPATFLGTSGLGKKIVSVEAKQTFFVQGTPAKDTFYIQEGRAKLTVVSSAGKEATIALLAAGDSWGRNRLPQPPASGCLLQGRSLPAQHSRSNGRR